MKSSFANTYEHHQAWICYQIIQHYDQYYFIPVYCTISHHPSLTALCYIQNGIYMQVYGMRMKMSHLWEQKTHDSHKKITFQEIR